MLKRLSTRMAAVVLVLVLLAGTSRALVIEFSDADVITNTVFNNVSTFAFSIDIDAPLGPGVFDNPALNVVDYSVSGTLPNATPSTFPAFALVRSITNADFYGQGSSLNFEIAADADLSDGLQVSDLAGDDLVFLFNGREIDNGRFHPAILELHANGTGIIQNSNNVPSLDPLVEVDFGEEYITTFTFDPSSFTLSSETLAVPEPATVCGLIGMMGVMATRRRRK